MNLDKATEKKDRRSGNSQADLILDDESEDDDKIAQSIPSMKPRFLVQFARGNVDAFLNSNLNSSLNGTPKPKSAIAADRFALIYQEHNHIQSSVLSSIDLKQKCLRISPYNTKYLVESSFQQFEIEFELYSEMEGCAVNCTKSESKPFSSF